MSAPHQPPPSPPENSRREFLGLLGRGYAALAVGGVLGAILLKRQHERSTNAPAHSRPRSTTHDTVWQIDPAKCTQCGLCATSCVLTPSAVKCFHAHAICGYCDLCTGYFEAQAPSLNTAAENQQCPTAAIRRKFVEDPYYEYVIDRDLCLGCGLCVKGCQSYGNGSLYLQIDHSRCTHCNVCSIVDKCKFDAVHRIPVVTPYLSPQVRGA